MRSDGTARVAAATTLVLLLAGCMQDRADRTPLQQVDWRNGPYADPCDPGEASNYVDGKTVGVNGGEGRTQLSAVGYADFDGQDGDEAALTHMCEVGGGIVSLTVWTASDEGPRLVGEVESPPDLNVEDWSDDQGVLCVSFFLGDNMRTTPPRLERSPWVQTA